MYTLDIESKCKITDFSANSGNRLTSSYFCSVTGYDTQTSFTALIATYYRLLMADKVNAIHWWACIHIVQDEQQHILKLACKFIVA